MTNTQSLMRTNQYRIDDTISIYVPTIGEIYDYGEDEYYNIVQLLTSVPYDLMVQFDDVGVDYETVTEVQLFFTMLEKLCISKVDLSIIFKDFDIYNYRIAENVNDKEIVMLNPKNMDYKITKEKQVLISNTIRKIHFWKKTESKAGNDEAKEYLIERNRKKQRIAARKGHRSFLDESIIKLVNTEEFKYNYEECMDLSIYKFNASLQQIPKKKNWEQTMNGAYFGTVDLSKLDIEKIHWMSSI